jgi:hypothetical protein
MGFDEDARLHGRDSIQMRRICLSADVILLLVTVYPALAKGGHRLLDHFPILVQASLKVPVANKDREFLAYCSSRISHQALSGYS